MQEGQEGRDWVGITGLRNVLKWGDARLVVSNACKSAAGRGGEDAFNGMVRHCHPLSTGD